VTHGSIADQPDHENPLTHRHHPPSKSVVETTDKEPKSLQADLLIDEACVDLERSLTGSPPFNTSRPQAWWTSATIARPNLAW
jgi:hypothetical protein